MATKAGKRQRPWKQEVRRCQKMEDRPRSRDEYHTARWTRESRVFREDHPLCEICWKQGIITPSEVVDHIIPVAICQDFWDKRNWQALCKKCNIKKGNQDKKLIHGRSTVGNHS